MAAAVSIDLSLPDPAATSQLGRRLADIAMPADCLLLHGDLGSGKTHLARAFITQRLVRHGRPVEEVPSPTFTLVQTYDDGETEIWHADLYRLSGPDDVVELGLVDAMESAICLIEWPDRLGHFRPNDPLDITLDMVGDARRVTLASNNPRWAALEAALA